MPILLLLKEQSLVAFLCKWLVLFCLKYLLKKKEPVGSTNFSLQYISTALTMQRTGSGLANDYQS